VNSERLMAKAQRALAAATRAAQAGDTETAADRVYYSVYYAAWALLDSRGLPRPKTHRGLIAEFSRLFVKDGPLDTASGAVLSRLENLRLVADYTLSCARPRPSMLIRMPARAKRPVNVVLVNWAP
jgi:uncharacterized protein (UPF0332 family)